MNKVMGLLWKMDLFGSSNKNAVFGRTRRNHQRCLMHNFHVALLQYGHTKCCFKFSLLVLVLHDKKFILNELIV